MEYDFIICHISYTISIKGKITLSNKKDRCYMLHTLNIQQPEIEERLDTPFHAYSFWRSSLNLAFSCSLFILRAAVTNPDSGVHGSASNFIFAGISDFSSFAALPTWREQIKEMSHQPCIIYNGYRLRIQLDELFHKHLWKEKKIDWPKGTSTTLNKSSTSVRRMEWARIKFLTNWA